MVPKTRDEAVAQLRDGLTLFLVALAALAAMSVIDPLLALFGRGTTFAGKKVTDDKPK